MIKKICIICIICIIFGCSYPVTSEDIKEAETACECHGGLDKYHQETVIIYEYVKCKNGYIIKNFRKGK